MTRASSRCVSLGDLARERVVLLVMPFGGLTGRDIVSGSTLLHDVEASGRDAWTDAAH